MTHANRTTRKVLIVEHMTRVIPNGAKRVVDRGQNFLMNKAMTERPRTLTVKMSDPELARLHALAAAGDESIGRLVRRWVAREYEVRFGDAAPPKAALRRGRPRKKAATSSRRTK